MRPTSKKGRLVRNLAIPVKSGIAATSSRLFKGSPAFTKWILVRVLAMGVLMSAGTAIYFDLASEGAVGAPVTELDREARPENGDARYIRNLNNDDEWRFGSPYFEDFSADAKPGSPASPRTGYTPSDEWRLDSPYYDDFQSISAHPLSKEALAVYQRDDDEWLYHSPYIQVFPENDPSAYPSLEEFDQAVTTKDAPNYHQQRGGDSLEERMEAQRVWQKILGE